MKRVIIVILAALAVFLCWYMVKSIMKPINFEKDKKVRYEVAIQSLKDIRTAQLAYKSVYGGFTGSFDTLINFVKQDSFRVVRQIGSMDDSAAVAQGLVRRDTIKLSVKDSLFRAGYPIDSLANVPFAPGAKFELEAGKLQTGSKLVIPVFQAQVANKVLLNGLEYQYIVNLDDVAKQLNRYPGLRVGSMTEATNNAGNWE